MLKKVYLPDHHLGAMNVIVWFCDMFGPPQEWNDIFREPTSIDEGFNWINGRIVPPGWLQSTPVIWCREEVYTWYKLKWL